MHVRKQTTWSQYIDCATRAKARKHHYDPLLLAILVI
jgi:hypothetical protein